MERVPIRGWTDLHEVVTGVYEVVFDDGRSDEIRLYDIESEYVEAEIEFPYIGVNRRKWEEWSSERRLEVLLHEFAHVEEGEDDLDHDPPFYDRLAALADVAGSRGIEIEALFGAPIDFRAVHEHIVESVNEYTVEPDIEGIEDRRSVLREAFELSSGANGD